jgi:hypothetical protein
MRMSERSLVGNTPVDLPAVIPPRSVVVLRAADHTTPTWRNDVGRKFRVGYYRRKDGLDCIWLVNDAGEYEQTTDRQTLLQYFSIEKLSGEKDHYGEARPKLPRLKDTAHTAKNGRRRRRRVSPA